jgi:hypothetical protein
VTTYKAKKDPAQDRLSAVDRQRERAFVGIWLELGVAVLASADTPYKNCILRSSFSDVGE